MGCPWCGEVRRRLACWLKGKDQVGLLVDVSQDHNWLKDKDQGGLLVDVSQDNSSLVDG